MSEKISKNQALLILCFVFLLLCFICLALARLTLSYPEWNKEPTIRTINQDLSTFSCSQLKGELSKIHSHLQRNQELHLGNIMAMMELKNCHIGSNARYSSQSLCSSNKYGSVTIACRGEEK